MISGLVLLYALLFSNFGLSILLFTGIIRLVTLPLTLRQLRQTRMMSLLQPKMKALQAKYAGDRQRIGQETMRMYREAGINPLGCLGPMLIQFPIWIGLYQALIVTLPGTPESLVNLSQQLYGWLPAVHAVVPLNSNFLWLDLAKPDSLPVMAVLVGTSTWIQQKMTIVPSADPRQASTNRMLLWMLPLMLAFFTFQFPSGLAVYWVASNAIGVGIQYFISGWGPLFARAPVPPPDSNLQPDKEVDDHGDREDQGDREEGNLDNEWQNRGRSHRISPQRTRTRKGRGRGRSRH